MVLRSQDHALHPGVPEEPAPLFGVRLLQGEHGRVLDAAPPFHAREGVGAEMDESGEAVLQGVPLLRRRDDANGLGEHRLRRIIGFNGQGACGRRRTAGGQQDRDHQGNLAHNTQK